MRILFTGSRSIVDYNAVKKAYEESELECTGILHGGANGVDENAGKLAEELNVPIEVIRPNWRRYKGGAGYQRNYELVDAADKVIAVWDGKSKGTEHAIKYAKKQGKLAWVKYVKPPA